MNDYIKLFETKSAYDAAKSTLPTPNVSLIEDTGTVKYSSVVSTIEFIDLGLPSGTLWATCNIGANSPEEDGLFFSWGNVQGHTGTDGYDFSQTTYNSTSGHSLSGDIPTNSTYDAAVAIKGEGWAMPTRAQFVELFNNEYTTNVWTKVNGKSGRLVTSKINNKSVFFPASGYFAGATHYYLGSYGYYWSSSYYVEYSAYGLGFDSGGVNPLSGYNRCDGLLVRPVQNVS